MRTVTRIVLTWLSVLTLITAVPAAAAQRSDKPNFLFRTGRDYGFQGFRLAGIRFQKENLPDIPVGPVFDLRTDGYFRYLIPVPFCMDANFIDG